MRPASLFHLFGPKRLLGERSWVRISSITIAALAFAAVVLFVTGYMPGTIKLESTGSMSGTGWWRYYYNSGALKLEDYHVAGRLRVSRWYLPDGRLFAETRWGKGTCVGYYLREDGSLKIKMEYRNVKANGMAVYYKEDGVTIDRVAEFRDGVKINDGEPGPGRGSIPIRVIRAIRG